jgi:hypothetical protein
LLVLLLLLLLLLLRGLCRLLLHTRLPGCGCLAQGCLHTVCLLQQVLNPEVPRTRCGAARSHATAC